MTATDFFDFRPEAVASRLSLTVDVMRELSRAVDAQAMYGVFARRMAEIFPTDRQISVSRRGLEAPRVRVTRFNLWTHDVNPWTDADKLPVLDRGLFSELVHDGRPRIIDELAVPADDPAAPFLAGQRSLMAVPLFDGGDAVNMVVLTREQPGAFPPERAPDLVWMSNLFGRATQAALLTQQLQAANDQAQHEMRQIAKLQRALLPAELPRVSTLDLAVYSRSTATAGGDYYDVMPLPRGRVGVLLADVCGHGASSAMLVAVVHSLVKTYSGPPMPPGLLLAYVNDHLSQMYTRSFGTFVTAVYAVYDPDRATLTWANAGHPPPRLVRADGAKREVLKGARCVPLGIVDGTEYPEAEVSIKPGDQVLLHTDGVTDAKGGADEAFGTDRLDAALGKAPAAGARGMISGVLSALEAFTNGTPPADDYTLLAMKFVKSRKKAGEISGEWRALGR
jgi:sigma-B regulation protein RsbU (phosphoserine phosphatase)